jgi:hypothetical protein
MMVVILFEILFFVKFVTKIIHNIKDVELLIDAHLLVIAKSGIDPVTTPTYKKLSKFLFYKYITLLYLFIYALIPFTQLLFPEIPYWLTDLIDEIIDIFVIFMMFLFFRMTEDNTSGYELIQPDTVDFDEIDPEQLSTGNDSLKKWERGMKLPPPPKVNFE